MKESRNNKNKNKNKKGKNGTSILVHILLILILLAGVLLVLKIGKDAENMKQTASNNSSNITGNTNKEENKQEKPKEPKTFAGNERAIAFMIDNNINAMPQAGLLEADLVYEIIVEGGETRLMAVIKNKNLEKIGPLRSARHYFLDYALENDAIYVHYGQSPQAKTDISKLNISDINGINESEKNFWRVSSRYAPHNAVTSTEKIKSVIERKGFRTTSDKGSVLNYSAEEIELESQIEQNDSSNTKNNNEQKNEEKTNTIKSNEMQNNENKTSSNGNVQSENNSTKIKNLANKVTIPYSSYNTVKYEYDEETKTYIRYSRNKKQVDWDTEENVTAKNIIITKCKNTTLNDGTTKGRQTIDNIKKLDGYYITNGKYIKITCEKTSRSGKTVYKDLDGNEIKVNDGKTFIQICPINSKISFE